MPTRTPSQREWMDDVDLHVLAVNRYDTNDVPVGTQYFVLMTDDEKDGGAYIVSSVASPPEPVE